MTQCPNSDRPRTDNRQPRESDNRQRAPPRSAPSPSSASACGAATSKTRCGACRRVFVSLSGSPWTFSVRPRSPHAAAGRTRPAGAESEQLPLPVLGDRQSTKASVVHGADSFTLHTWQGRLDRSATPVLLTRLLGRRRHEENEGGGRRRATGCVGVCQSYVSTVLA